MTSMLKHMFDDIGWIISVQNNEDDDESIYFTKTNIEISPNYQPRQ